jgi:hypothetical protein
MFRCWGLESRRDFPLSFPFQFSPQSYGTGTYPSQHNNKRNPQIATPMMQCKQFLLGKGRNVKPRGSFSLLLRLAQTQTYTFLAFTFNIHASSLTLLRVLGLWTCLGWISSTAYFRLSGTSLSFWQCVFGGRRRKENIVAAGG